MTDQPRRVTLSKAHQALPAGQELVALLTELSDDGEVTRQELARLRAWLEVDRGVDFPACAFLYEIVEPLAGDGDIPEDELDKLALAIERVLPAEMRAQAAAKRKAHRAARRADAAQRRQTAREQERNARLRARERARPLHRGDFVVMGARRSAERREGCAALIEGEPVTLEREPDNRHDANAILVFSADGCELGYVPREDARDMAPLIDAGAYIEARVKKLLETEEGGDVIPVVISVLRRGPEHDAKTVWTPEPQATESFVADQRAGVGALPGAFRAALVVVALMIVVMASYCAQ